MGALAGVTPGGVAYLLMGYYPSAALARHLVRPSLDKWQKGEQLRTLAIFAGQTVINTAAFGVLGHKVFGAPMGRAIAGGLGVSLAMSASMFALAYRDEKRLAGEAPALPSTTGPVPLSKTSGLVSPEF